MMIYYALSFISTTRLLMVVILNVKEFLLGLNVSAAMSGFRATKAGDAFRLEEKFEQVRPIHCTSINANQQRIHFTSVLFVDLDKLNFHRLFLVY